MGFHKLHAVEWGRRRSGRLVVCAHGYSGNARDFDFLARRLAREARVVCPDVAGRGRSAWLATPLAYHFPQFLADLRALVSELGEAAVDWVGTSMGGLLGMLLAAEPHSFVRRLVLNDVGAFIPARALAAIGRNLHGPQRFPSLAELEQHVRRTHRGWGRMSERQFRHLVKHAARRFPDGYALHYDPQIASLVQPLALAPGLSFWNAWRHVRCPVLIVRGQRSSILPREVVRAMVQAKPQTRVVEVAGAGHAPSLMEDAQIEAVAQFLERREAKTLPPAA
ncbi:MAG TPA: alpha/beta fold hydrolase [Usitatibacter sp.]|nr:alpha/beta fold hydrolase [Usitatibacter sp.]